MSDAGRPHDDAPGDVWKSGIGFRGMFAADSIRLHLQNVRRERGDVTGLLTVEHDHRDLYCGKFNIASHTSRTGLERYLKGRDHDYGGWGVALEEFCRQVIALESEGPPTTTLGALPRRAAPLYRLHPVIPRDAATIWFAPGGAGKSTLAAGAGVSVQAGVPLLSDWIPTQGNVLVCDWEADEEAWNDRVVGIAEGLGIAPPPIRYRRCSRRLADLTESLSDQVARENIALLIVDSVGLAQGSSSEGGDANEATLRMFDALRAIGTTSLLIDHVRGDEIGNGRASTKPYGSTYKVNLARSVFELRREEQPAYPEATQMLLRHIKVNDSPLLKPQGIRIITGERAITFERCIVDAPDLEQHSGPTHDRMRRILGRSGAMAEPELAEVLGVSRGVVRVTMNRHDGFVRNPDGRIGLKVL